MKLKVEVIIDADRETVWRHFDDPDMLPKWQPTLESCDYTSGKPGHPDTVCVLRYVDRGRARVVTETITARREPDFLAGTSVSDRGNAVIVNHFDSAGENSTRWIAYWNFSFTGVAKLTSFVTHRSIRRRIEDDMNRFKLLVETAESTS